MNTIFSLKSSVFSPQMKCAKLILWIGMSSSLLQSGLCRAPQKLSLSALLAVLSLPISSCEESSNFPGTEQMGVGEQLEVPWKLLTVCWEFSPHNICRLCSFSLELSCSLQAFIGYFPVYWWKCEPDGGGWAWTESLWTSLRSSAELPLPSQRSPSVAQLGVSRGEIADGAKLQTAQWQGGEILIRCQIETTSLI